MRVGLFRIFCLLTIFLLLSSFVLATDDLQKDLEGKVEDIEGIAKTVADKEERNEYLFAEWSKLLEKNKVGRFFLAISDFLENLSPVFEILLGIPYILSWLFFLTLLFWIAIIVIIFKPLNGFTHFGAPLSFLISIAVAVLTARSGGIELGLNIYLLPLLDNPWVIGISFVILLVLVFVYALYMQKIVYTIRKHSEKERKAREEMEKDLEEKIRQDKLRAQGASI